MGGLCLGKGGEPETLEVVGVTSWAWLLDAVRGASGTHKASSALVSLVLGDLTD